MLMSKDAGGGGVQPAPALGAAAVQLTPGVWPAAAAGLPFAAAAAGIHPNLDHRIALWLDEQIWGHRLWDAQSPWLIFLEFLTVAEACQREGRLLEGDAAYPLRYRPRQRMPLRNILFNSDDATRVAEEQRDSTRAWEVWLARMPESAGGVHSRDFSYLRQRFFSFGEFAQVVRLVRGAAVERQSNKRWSSRFVFPFGPHALYVDLNYNDATGRPNREYINFGRSGELLYMMLSRSARRAEIAPVVRGMVAGTNRWDRLVATLQPEGEEDRADEGNSCYLPYLRHPIFDSLARDWLAISRLQLPQFDGYPHLVTLGALHLLRYHLAIAGTWSGEGDRPALVCEIVAPKKTLVRDLAVRSYGQNDGLSTRAVEQFVERIRRSAAWREATASQDAFERCRGVLREAVFGNGTGRWWGDTYEGANNPEDLLAALKRDARKDHQRHAAQVHRSYGREIGLVSRRGTTRFRYAPTDQLMKTLLFASVGRRMEFGEFLGLLYERYGLVIGDREAELALPTDDFDRKAFQANARRLEERLASLGLLRRLSDACAYVENPYGG